MTFSSHDSTGVNLRLDAALGYAARGWQVIPLNTPVEGGCSCQREDCTKVGKHPRTAHGLNDGTTDEGVIRDWWGMWPDANVGIVTGIVSGLAVLDVDPRHGGDDSLRELEAQHGVLPRTLRTRTGGGGEHVLFSYPPNEEPGKLRNRTKFLTGLDWRGDGGYIVAPPSLHASGERYEWIDGPEDVQLVPPPEWLMALAKGGKTTSPAKGLIDSGQKAYQELVGGKVPEGSRNVALTSLAGDLRRIGFGEEIIAAVLVAVNERCCALPLSEGEVEGIARSICKYPPNFPLDIGVVGGSVDSSFPQLTYNNPSLMVGSEVTSKVNAKIQRDEAKNMGAVELPYLPFLGKQGFIVEGWTHLIAASPKVGKTELLVQLCISWGDKKVLYITEEPPQLWDYRLLRLSEWEPGNILYGMAASSSRLLNEILNGDEQIVVIDTIRLLGLKDENDNSALMAQLRPVVAICQARRKTLILVHHMRKSGGEYGEGIAGGHALLGLVDVALEIRRDKKPNRRKLKALGRGGISGDLLYEMRENGLMVPLGRSSEMALEGVKERISAVLTASENWLKTAEVLEAIEAPPPSLEQVRLSLVELSRAGRVERHPPLGELGQGKTHSWRIIKESQAGESESECLAA
jgi:Bifunctional DNA primase/polymerase, N-terminal/AAA domain/Primase C terminal 1 (PriCT-1)